MAVHRGNLKTIIGLENFEEYFSFFLQFDSYKPSDTDLLKDIQDDFWILYDSDFPVVQCLEETTNLFGDFVPAEFRLDRFWTEYGMPIDKYDLNFIGEIVVYLQRQRVTVEIFDLPPCLEF